MPNGEVLDELNLIPFVGELRAKVLRENGIRDVETLLKYPIEKLAELDGFSMKIAQKIRRYAAEVESLGLVGKEPIKELVLREFRCPRCDAIVSSGESVCHRCGKVFYPSPPNAEDIIANSHFEILKNPDDPEVWRKRAMILENLGLHDESTICMLKVDFLEMFESERPPKEERKRPVKKGLVNGNGVVANNGVVGGLFPKIESRKTLPFLIVVMIILPIIVLSTSLATKGIEIDGYFDDWKNIKGIELYSQDNIIQEIKYYNDGRTFIYIKFGENIFASPKKYYYTVIGVFFDTDMNNGTGYKIGGIGADKVLLMYGYGGKVKSAKFMNYKGEGINWKWDEGVKVSAKTDGKEVEVGLPNIDKFVALVVYRDVGGEVVSSTFSTSKGVFCIITDEDLNIISKNENVCTIKLYSLSPEGTTISLRLINKGTAKEASFQILDETGNVISTSGEISQLRVNKPRNLMVVYTGGASSGESIYLDVKIDGKSYVKNYARGKYIDTMPSSPIIDGVYADWNYISDKGDSTDKDVDICWAAMYSKNNTTLLSLAVCGEILKGLYMPVSLYMDLDRDTVPDPEDEYPNDFNNDGVPDSESKTSDGKPDIDGDGIADYPYGDDMWLNTTANGKNISIKLGVKGEVAGYSYVRIYLDVDGNPNTGYKVSGIGADKIISVKGFDGKILDIKSENINGVIIHKNQRYMEIFVPTSSLSTVLRVVVYNGLYDESVFTLYSSASYNGKLNDKVSNPDYKKSEWIPDTGDISLQITKLRVKKLISENKTVKDEKKIKENKTIIMGDFITTSAESTPPDYVINVIRGDAGSGWIRDRQVSSSSYNETKVSMAVDSDGYIYVAVRYYFASAGRWGIMVYRSGSGGDSWTDTSSTSWGFYHSSYDLDNPSIAITGNGTTYGNRIFVAYQLNYSATDRDIYVAWLNTSDFGVDNWIAKGVDTDTDDDFDPTICVSMESPYVVIGAYTHTYSSSDHDILGFRSTDGGATWTSEINIFSSWEDEKDPSIAYASNGIVNVSFVVYYSESYSTNWNVAVIGSSDYGSTWPSTAIYWDTPGNDYAPDIVATHFNGTNPYIVISWTNNSTLSPTVYTITVAAVRLGISDWTSYYLGWSSSTPIYSALCTEIVQGTNRYYIGMSFVNSTGVYYYETNGPDVMNGTWYYLGSKRVSDSSGSPSTLFRPDCAMDNAGWPLVVWSDSRNGNLDAYFTRPGGDITIRIYADGSEVSGTQWTFSVSGGTGVWTGSYNPPYTFNWPAGYKFTVSVASTQNGYTFDHWTKDGSTYSTSVTIYVYGETTDHTYIAYYVNEISPLSIISMSMIFIGFALIRRYIFG